MRKKFASVTKKQLRESSPKYREQDRAYRNARKLGVPVEVWREMLLIGVVQPRENVLRLFVRSRLSTAPRSERKARASDPQ
jgi:hypothetical protein